MSIDRPGDFKGLRALAGALKRLDAQPDPAFT